LTNQAFHGKVGVTFCGNERFVDEAVRRVLLSE
jgi:hypothetical protein